MYNSMKTSADFISLFARCDALLSQGVEGSNPLQGMYPLVARNEAIPEKAFLSELTSNSAMDKKFI